MIDRIKAVNNRNKKEAIYKACEQIATSNTEFSCHALKDVNRALELEYRKFIKSSNYIWKEWGIIYPNDTWDEYGSDSDPRIKIGLRVLTLLLFLEIGLKGIQ